LCNYADRVLNTKLVLLLVIFNQIMNHKQVPNKMKISKTIPSLKPGKNKSKFESHWGIAIQNNLYKMFDNIILNKVYSSTYENISNSQYGFKKGISLYNQHIDIQKKIFEALNDFSHFKNLTLYHF
jgi:hypothetical protein